MDTSNDSASLNMKVHARAPGLALLVSDLKKLVHLVRTAMEHSQDSHLASDERDAASRAPAHNA